jgi:hypothetical protein
MMQVCEERPLVGQTIRRVPTISASILDICA